MPLTENSNELFSSWGVQQTRKIAHIYQFGPYTIYYSPLVGHIYFSKVGNFYSYFNHNRVM